MTKPQKLAVKKRKRRIEAENKKGIRIKKTGSKKGGMEMGRERNEPKMEEEGRNGKNEPKTEK